MPVDRIQCRRVPCRDLKPGDTLVWLNKSYRVTKITPYDGVQSFRDAGAFGIAHVEGHGEFISLWDGQWISVAS